MCCCQQAAKYGKLMNSKSAERLELVMDKQERYSDQDMRKKLQYISLMGPILNKKALYTDTSEEYCRPQNISPGERLTVRFRTGKNNVDAVYAVTKNGKNRMQKVLTHNAFDYYETSFIMTGEPLHYYFEIIFDKMTYYYCSTGVAMHIEERYSFEVLPDFQVPDWAKGAVMYQIFVDRFYNGDPSNDVEEREYIYIQDGTKKVTDWFKYPEAMDVQCFYGGDLQGVMDKLDYLQRLGVEVIYLNPIFVSPSNHKYDIQDYDYVDPHFGKIVEDGGAPLDSWVADNKQASKLIRRVTDKKNLEASNQLFIRLVEEIHKRGMKVILDGVFNHCGSFNKWLDRERLYEDAEEYEPGAFVSKDSPYRDYFRFAHDVWPYNPSYEGWWGHDTLPKLNYEGAQALHDEILRIGKKWVSAPYQADGWRLDVAADLGHSVEYNHQFWKDFRKAVKEANPDALILAEHYGDPGPWLRGDEWDTVMNYDAFMEPVTWYLTGMEKHSDEYRDDLKNNLAHFQEIMRRSMNMFGNGSLLSAMNELSNHDHSRFLTRTNGKVGRTATLGPEAANSGVHPSVLREAVVIQMTWPGAPTIYYGDEAGLCGFTDPDSRRTYPWGREDFELIEFHRDMIKIHKKYPVLRTGSISFLPCDQPILCYGRFNLKEQVIVAVNNFDESKDVEISVWYTGMAKETVLTQVMETGKRGYSIGKVEREIHGGVLKVSMSPKSAMVFYHREVPEAECP